MDEHQPEDQCIWLSMQVPGNSYFMEQAPEQLLAPLQVFLASLEISTVACSVESGVQFFSLLFWLHLGHTLWTAKGVRSGGGDVDSCSVRH